MGEVKVKMKNQKQKTLEKRVNIIVHGRVQGVGFRLSTIEKARGLDLKGWVRNCEDGAVEITAEGEEENLEKFIAWCRHGPLFAQVTRLDLAYSNPTNEFRTFDLRIP